MFSKVDYVMVNVSDMGLSVAFYRDTLGLRLKFESPGWSEFETGATTLALHLGARRGGRRGRGPGRARGGDVLAGLLGVRPRSHPCGAARAEHAS